MDFIEQLQVLSGRVVKQRDVVLTEEAAKNAFVMPFISILGYDVFDPTEVVPEFVADVGIKKGEKVDYAIRRDGKIVMLFECKACDVPLDIEHASQLYRYFSVTEARVAVLTNGVLYRFFTDLEEPNKMDSKPFMEIDMSNIQEALVPELKRLTKKSFNLEEIITTASELKYTREIKSILAEQFVSPSDDFVRFFAQRIYTGRLTQQVREQLVGIIKRAMVQFVNDRINERLRSAMADTSNRIPDGSASQAEPVVDTSPDEADQANKIVTTEEEMQGYFIVKAILRESVEPSRIALRDMQSYCGILLDNNNRKPICRLRFNGKQKYLGLFNAEKQEERVPIDTIDDIYAHAARLKQAVEGYGQGS